MWAIASGRVSQTLIFAARSSGLAFSKAVAPLPQAAFCRLFSAIPEKQDKDVKANKTLWRELFPKSKFSYFSNPEIESDWEIREDEDTGKKFYFNKVTQDKVYMRPVLKPAPLLRRVGAGFIDVGISLGMNLSKHLISSWCWCCWPVGIF